MFKSSQWLILAEDKALTNVLVEPTSTKSGGPWQEWWMPYLTICIVFLSYLSSFTPITNMGASFDGAEMITFLAPPVM